MSAYPPDQGRLITSLTNETVKAVRALHMRKEREATGLFLAEGLKFIGEALDQGRTPTTLLVGMEARAHPLLDRAIAETRRTGGDVVTVTHPILEKISRRENPQTVLAVFEQAFTRLDDIDPASAPCWVALEQVRDPGNLGTIIRTADAAGCGGVILIGDCVDPFSVEAVRATMGSVFAVAIARATPEAFLTWRAKWSGSVIGTRLDATHGYRDAPLSAPTLILMGNEQAGLTDSLASACDVNVKIPMRGRADSLNLAVATGIMVYAVTDALADS
ncbi:TrmH family RNA methyltransferase [Brevundimonas variabilis]|uniref:TrmH family RNA methyltransferase n=1 Tax=Brevundimonas variabilis TaxID=74312 RepID=A0A7W9FFY1_9CAUL|nr:RNA methyltransferase [Brevundimonas variabilis]MBB5745844.1 TrmH family RNA methyltransferase [Brevundimonas variabilis]